MNPIVPQITTNIGLYRKTERQIEVRGLRALGETSQTQQTIADELGVPRTTLQYWMYRKQAMQEEIDPLVVEFYESPAGLAHLHRLMTAVMYSFHKTSGCGIPTMQMFLQLSQLNKFIASSTGSIHKVSKEHDGNIVNFGDEETDRLSKNMQKRNISVVGDETFFPGTMILLMMDPVSNYIITEEHSDQRDALSWDRATSKALKGLNVNVIQLTGDEGSGLRSFTKNILGVHKASDLFHVQQDISKAIGGLLARKVKSLEKDIEKKSTQAQQAYNKVKAPLLEFDGDLLTSSDPLILQMIKLADLDKDVRDKTLQHQQILDDQSTVSQKRREIGDLYHPYDFSLQRKNWIFEKPRHNLVPYPSELFADPL